MPRKTLAQSLRDLENENASLRLCVETYFQSQGPLLREIGRLRKLLAKGEGPQ